MASRLRSISRPAFSFIKNSMRNPSRPIPPPSPFHRVFSGELGALRSLLPLHSALSSARLTSRLGLDSARPMCQELGLGIPR